MADYIYTMEIRLTPDQQRGVTLVQDIARDGELSELWSLVNSASAAFDALQSGRVGVGG